LSTPSIARVPHVHAEVIKAWADGAQIEYRPDGQQHWTLCGRAFKPSWAEEYEYRVKPERVYPTTKMAMSDFDSALARAGSKESIALHVVIGIANAALRHAIDAGQIITIADHQTELFTLGDKLRDVEIARHAARDMAIAKAMCHWYGAFAPSESALISVIAKVRP
jgi:hypothetical protein